MTVYDPATSLKQLEAFKYCSEEALQAILKNGSRIGFATGHSLSTNALIPDRVLVILNGRARLLGDKNGRPVTLGLMGPGSLIGLPSLLRQKHAVGWRPGAWSISAASLQSSIATKRAFKNSASQRYSLRDCLLLGGTTASK